MSHSHTVVSDRRWSYYHGQLRLPRWALKISQHSLWLHTSCRSFLSRTKQSDGEARQPEEKSTRNQPGKQTSSRSAKEPQSASRALRFAFSQAPNLLYSQFTPTIFKCHRKTHNNQPQTISFVQKNTPNKRSILPTSQGGNVALAALIS